MLTINQCYLDFVDKILKSGKETYKDSNHHLVESLGNFYIIDDPFNLKFRAKYQHYTPEQTLMIRDLYILIRIVYMLILMLTNSIQ